MKEDFLHYIWRFQYFDKTDLACASGMSISVLHPGHAHHNAGPDFGEARVKVGDMAWVGSVEIHVRASDWYRHGHQHDAAYDSVVLHVVWEDDREVRRQDGSLVPCLALENRIMPGLQARYGHFMTKQAALPCAPHLEGLPGIVRLAAIERSLIERFEQRCAQWQEQLSNYGGDWEQAAYQQLCRYLGGPVNASPMEILALHLPWRELRRHHSQPERLEALVFGHAGFLAFDTADAYQVRLRKVFAWLCPGVEGALPAHAWKWSRMRPAQFPTMRLAHLAGIAGRHPDLLSDALGVAHDLKKARAFLKLPVPSYWQEHVYFGKQGKGPAHWGNEGLLINWLAPFWYAYGVYRQEPDWQERALALLASLPRERNRLLRPYAEAGFELRTAADTQGVLALRQSYCAPKQCLSCSIGVKLMQVLQP